MSRTDSVADGLTVVRNAYMARKEEAIIPFSYLLQGIMDILKKQGYIENCQSIKQNNLPYIKVFLKYIRNKPALTSIRKISIPSRRRYVSKRKIPRVGEGAGIAIISTSLGVMTSDDARKTGVGGEVVCYVI